MLSPLVKILRAPRVLVKRAPGRFEENRSASSSRTDKQVFPVERIEDAIANFFEMLEIGDRDQSS